jgi:hypothetical protein
MRWKWAEKPKVGASPTTVLHQVPRQAHDGRRHRHGSGSDLTRQASATYSLWPFKATETVDGGFNHSSQLSF